MVTSHPPRARRTMALLVAPHRRNSLHELTLTECCAALPFAHGVKVIDFQLHNLQRAGLRDVVVLQPGLATSELREHVRLQWRPAFSRMACLGGPAATPPNATPEDLRRAQLARFIALLDEAGLDDLLLLSGDHVCDADVAELIAGHQRERNLVTLAAQGPDDAREPRSPTQRWLAAMNDGMPTGIDMAVLDWRWLAANLSDMLACLETGPSLPEQIIMAASREVGLRLAVPEGRPGYWKRLDSLDRFRSSWLELMSGDQALRHLPPTAARNRQWRDGVTNLPNLRESVLMPGASIDSRAEVRRAILAPGSHVPAGMVIGHDPDRDARHFRVTEGGTVLVTPAMIAAATMHGWAA